MKYVTLQEIKEPRLGRYWSDLGSTNLDTLIGLDNWGTYSQSSAASATAALNYPTSNGGILVVYGSANQTIQIYYVMDATGTVYTRTKNGANAWTNWGASSMVGHNHDGSYVEQSGGVIIGSPTMSNGVHLISKQNYTDVLGDPAERIIDAIIPTDNDSFGPGMIFQTGGSAYLGSGLSSATIRDNVADKTKKQVFLSSDEDIRIDTNLNAGYANRKTIIIDSSGTMDIKNGTVKVDGSEIYHPGNKPTPASINAIDQSDQLSDLTVSTNNLDSLLAGQQMVYHSSMGYSQPLSVSGSAITVTENGANGDHGMQLWSNANTSSPKLYLRGAAGAGWGAWKKIYSETQKPTASDLGFTNNAFNKTFATSGGLNGIGTAVAREDHGHELLASLGADVTVNSGRTSHGSGVYTYGFTLLTSNKPAFADYGSVIGFGNGDGGSVEIASGWHTGDGKIRIRSLRNVTDSWTGWTKVYTDQDKPSLADLGAAGTSLVTTSASGLMSSTDKTKLNGLSNYTHPTTDGNKHVPSGGASGQFLGYSTTGTAKWVDNPDTNYSHPTTSGNRHVPSGGALGQFLGYNADGTAKWVNNPNTHLTIDDVPYNGRTYRPISSNWAYDHKTTHAPSDAQKNSDITAAEINSKFTGSVWHSDNLVFNLVGTELTITY